MTYSYQRDRDEFITWFARRRDTGTSQAIDAARIFLRAATTLHRLAEAQCNGDYPCDNGERKVKACAQCEGGYVPSVLKAGGLCPDCRLSAKVKALAETWGLVAVTGGDPRGAVLRLFEPGENLDSSMGRAVPAR